MKHHGSFFLKLRSFFFPLVRGLCSFFPITGYFIISVFMSSSSLQADSKLIAGLACQDERVIKSVYKQIFGFIMGHVRKHGGSEEQGIDMVHKVLLILIQQARGGKLTLYADAKLTTYATSIAKYQWLNLLRDMGREKRRMPMISLPQGEEDALHPLHNIPDSGPLPSDYQTRGYEDCMEEILEASIQQLPPSDKRMMDLRIKERVKLKEAGRLLGITESAAKQRYKRARLKLGELMQTQPNYEDCREHNDLSP